MVQMVYLSTTRSLGSWLSNDTVLAEEASKEAYIYMLLFGCVYHHRHFRIHFTLVKDYLSHTYLC